MHPSSASTQLLRLLSSGLLVTCALSAGGCAADMGGEVPEDERPAPPPSEEEAPDPGPDPDEPDPAAGTARAGEAISVDTAPLRDNEQAAAALEAYLESDSTKAIAFNATGDFRFVIEQLSQEEADRRSLEICEASFDTPCALLARDNTYLLDADAYTFDRVLTRGDLGAFDASAVPLVFDEDREGVLLDYQLATVEDRALSMTPFGGMYVAIDDDCDDPGRLKVLAQQRCEAFYNTLCSPYDSRGQVNYAPNYEQSAFDFTRTDFSADAVPLLSCAMTADLEQGDYTYVASTGGKTALAISRGGQYAWYGGQGSEEANRAAAVNLCEEAFNDDCFVYAVDFDVVMSPQDVYDLSAGAPLTPGNFVDNDSDFYTLGRLFPGGSSAE